jgi:DNA polymerase III subunit alpha
MARRADLKSMNRRVIESLIKAGAFDDFHDRGTLLNSVQEILSLAQKEQRLKESGQSTMFDFFGQAVSTPLPTLELQPTEVGSREKSQWEKELLGVALSKSFIKNKGPGMIWPSEIDAEMDGQSVSVLGEVALVAQLFTRDRKAFAKVVIEDISGSIEAMVWPRVYDKDRELWQEGNVVVIQGKVRAKEDGIQLTCDAAQKYVPSIQSPAPDGDLPDVHRVAQAAPAPGVPETRHTPSSVAPARGQRLSITLQTTDDSEADIKRLHRVVEIIRQFDGDDEVSLRIGTNGDTTCALLPGGTLYCAQLRDSLQALVGEGGITVQER